METWGLCEREAEARRRSVGWICQCEEDTCVGEHGCVFEDWRGYNVREVDGACC